MAELFYPVYLNGFTSVPAIEEQDILNRFIIRPPLNTIAPR